MFDKILLAVDGSECSDKAIPIAGDLASRLGAEVIVLHVREREITRAGGIDLETMDEAVDLADRAVRQLKEQGVSAWSEVAHAMYGRAAKEIITMAKAQDVDVIVMGSRGLSDLGDMLLGGVTHKVLHLSDRPVLVVR